MVQIASSTSSINGMGNCGLSGEPGDITLIVFTVSEQWERFVPFARLLRTGRMY